MTDILDDLSNLSSQAKRNIIRNQLPALILSGFNQQQAIEHFRNAGLGIRVQDFRNIYRAVAGEEDAANRVQFVGRDRVVTDSVLAPVRRRLPETYRLIFQADVMDTLTGETFRQFFAVDTDRLGIRRDLEADAEQAFIAKYPRFTLVAGGIQLRKGFVSSDEEGF